MVSLGTRDVEGGLYNSKRLQEGVSIEKLGIRFENQGQPLVWTVILIQ
jgi:hypothetical protein